LNNGYLPLVWWRLLHSKILIKGIFMGNHPERTKMYRSKATAALTQTRKRAVWEGTISFGLVNIPVHLYAAEKKSTVPFHLMDKRNHARIRYDRINAETGRKVEWKDIVKVYEYEKGRYVMIDEEALTQFFPKNGQSIDIENFIDQKSLPWIYIEKPYYLSPAKYGNKGYVLLRETLKRTHKIALTKVTIRAHQYLAAIIPQDDVLLLTLLRFPEDIEKFDKLLIPDQSVAYYKITAKEIAMSEKLVNSMTTKWNPKKYHNETKEFIMAWIDRKIKGKKTISTKQKSASKGNVVDFMKLLEKSVKKNDASTSPRKGKKHNFKA
jgi:DNA end-binding protein Ku